MCAAFFVNFLHYYILYFCGYASCNKKIVDFIVLAVLLHGLSTRAGKIQAHAFIICVHSSSFNTHSFSLTLNDPKRISLYSSLEATGTTHHTLYLMMAYCSIIASLVYAKTVDRSS
jgi:hypothetical protein